ncbi:MAG: hypothetical protein HFJ50_02240 [Clostridia bacterium]|nr:hypothetical protein [Clostridia bacterium]
MRELEGVNELHKANTAYNPRVLKAMKFAHSVKTPRDFIDCLAGMKGLENLNDRKEWEMPEELKNREINNDLDARQPVANEARNGLEERDDEER